MHSPGPATDFAWPGGHGAQLSPSLLPLYPRGQEQFKTEMLPLSETECLGQSVQGSLDREFL